MPQVDLSTLNTPELRRLLDATRARGDAKQSYKILQEMAARREGHGKRGPFLLRRPAEPRLAAVDLGDPMEPADDLPPMPSWRAPSPEPEASAAPPSPPSPSPPQQPPAQRRARGGRQAQPRQRAAAPPDLEPAPQPQADPPSSVADAVPDAPKADAPKADATAAKAWDLRLHPPTVESPQPLSGLRRGLTAGFVVGAALGVSVGWWAGGFTREAPRPQPAPAAAPTRTAALAPPPTQLPVSVGPIAAEPEPAPETAPPPAPTVAPQPEAGLSAPNAQGESRETGEAMELPAPAAEANTCAVEPTPADREICADPALRRLQGELRQAYAEALEAHQDRALLRQRQLAWKSARDAVSDPAQLARLYEQRIRKLNAATAEARRSAR